MATVFVHREGGVVTAVCGVKQPGFAEEEVADDAPEVVEWRERHNPRPDGPEQS